MADISATLVSNSTQLDNVDLMGGPRVFTITEVTVTGGEQPVSIRLAEYERPWKPGLTMRRLMAAIWETTEGDEWVGKRVRLYRDETVTFGRDKTGGTRISHASHIDKTKTETLPISKGKFAVFTVQPLTDAPTPTEPTAEQVAACTSVDELRSWWKTSTPERQAQIQARVTELQTADPGHNFPDAPEADA